MDILKDKAICKLLTKIISDYYGDNIKHNADMQKLLDVIKE